MNHNEYLANRLREILLSGKWVTGTNFKEQIEDLTWIEATKKVKNLNSIASLTFHINYYLSGVMDVFKGGELTIRDKYSFDAPEIMSEHDWSQLKETFVKNSKSFIEFVENMETERLMDVFVKEEYGSYYRSVDVIIEHTYYHLGQIILLKKMI
ncbi:DinB family protein [Winogradskyella jejuensis]|uniref:Uncharacterized damage-inducible protein DinB (Forms a four-helix bundle) n=1 Tax=Winogradskyella jejuensis TaxID=1089305 RepID=A0A1M5SEJ2_9FLAO|nr:DinB family protein [Winogradskyella jejuensis]SHH36333.1 Uncharacterized damage-inducible protein DinB (forms a four-helix bundle) [Winogradskyella jejuensis]